MRRRWPASRVCHVREDSGAGASRFAERLLTHQCLKQLQIDEVMRAIVGPRFPDRIGAGMHLLCNLPRQRHAGNRVVAGSPTSIKRVRGDLCRSQLALPASMGETSIGTTDERLVPIAEFGSESVRL